MGKRAVYTWPAADSAAVAQLQTVAGPGNLLINGNFATNDGINGGNPSVVFQSYSRTISVTSVNNLSAVNFTITGTLNGATMSVVIAGPNANTVSTTVFFDTVTAVSISAGVTAVSVGIGVSGQTRWFKGNTFGTTEVTAVQVVVTGTINYSFQSTLDDVNTTKTPATFNTISTMTGATTTQIAPHALISNQVAGAGAGVIYARFPYAYCNIFVSSGSVHW